MGLGRLPSTLVCPPGPVLGAGAEDSDVDFAAGGETTSSTLIRSFSAKGTAAITGRTLPPEGAEPADLAVEGAALAAVSTRSELPLVVEADRSQLLAGLQLTRTDEGDLAGLAASTCTAPAVTGWLVGGAVEPGRSGRIVLANPSRTTATVDLTVLTPEGAVRPPAGQGLSVAAGTSREVLLESLLPATTTVAVGVSARGAEIAAHLVETHLTGVRPQGVEQVVAQQAATSFTVPGVLTGARTATLRVANPGSEAAAVGWQVMGDAGVLPAAGETVVTVPAGGAVDVPLALTGPDGAPVGGLVAVQVGSDSPVVGAVQMTWGRAGGESERAWAAPAPEITDEAMALVGPQEVSTFLSLVSEGGADVLVQQLDADGELVDDELALDVAPGTTLTRAIDPELDPGVAAVRIRVVSGSVHASTALTADAPAAQPNTFFSVVPVQVPPRTTDEVTVAPLPEDLLR